MHTTGADSDAIISAARYCERCVTSPTATTATTRAFIGTTTTSAAAGNNFRG
jgi:hypothetical protein